jgi:hypothetical protein
MRIQVEIRVTVVDNEENVVGIREHYNEHVGDNPLLITAEVSELMQTVRERVHLNLRARFPNNAD